MGYQCHTSSMGKLCKDIWPCGSAVGPHWAGNFSWFPQTHAHLQLAVVYWGRKVRGFRMISADMIRTSVLCPPLCCLGHVLTKEEKQKMGMHWVVFKVHSYFVLCVYIVVRVYVYLCGDVCTWIQVPMKAKGIRHGYIQLKSSARAVWTLNHRAISPALGMLWTQPLLITYLLTGQRKLFHKPSSSTWEGRTWPVSS